MTAQHTIDLDELERLARAATQAEWYVDPDDPLWVKERGLDIVVARAVVLDEREANAAYIAAANPSAVLELIERLRISRESRQEAQLSARDAIEARNGARADFRKEIAEEIDRLKQQYENAKSAANQREAFIERLLAQRHAELMLAATNIYDQGWYDGNHGISRPDLCAGIVSNIELGRGQWPPNMKQCGKRYGHMIK